MKKATIALLAITIAISMATMPVKIVQAKSSHYSYKPIKFKSIFKIPKVKTYKIKY